MHMRSADKRQILARDPVIGSVYAEPGAHGALYDICPAHFVAIDEHHLFYLRVAVAKAYGIGGSDDLVDRAGEATGEGREIVADMDLGHPAAGMAVDQPATELPQERRASGPQDHRGEIGSRSQLLAAFAETRTAAAGR